MTNAVQKYEPNALPFLAEDGKIWVPIFSADFRRRPTGTYMLASRQVTKNIRKKWWQSGKKERQNAKRVLLCLGHSHIDKYLAKHIASFTYTKPPSFLLETYSG